MKRALLAIAVMNLFAAGIAADATQYAAVTLNGMDSAKAINNVGDVAGL